MYRLLQRVVIICLVLVILFSVGCMKAKERRSLNNTALYIDGTFIDDEITTIGSDGKPAMIPLVMTLQGYGAKVDWEENGKATIFIGNGQDTPYDFLQLFLDVEEQSIKIRTKNGYLELLYPLPGDTKELFEVMCANNEILVSGRYLYAVLYDLGIEIKVEKSIENNAVYITTKNRYKTRVDEAMLVSSVSMKHETQGDGYTG